MKRRVIFHVGTPKSGTSYLQNRLARNREQLLHAGLRYVETRSGDHFEASLDVLAEGWAGAEKQARGQWEELVRAAHQDPQDVLVTHEILAAARPEAVARAREAFPDHEHHVVLTVRDLGRQVPAEWQENVKHRSVRTYERFLRRVERRYETPREDRFWRVQHVPEIVRTWSHGLPPERVHLVTVPPAGARRGLLWERYSAALGLGETSGFADTAITNASLGSAEVTLLRLLNVELQERGLPREEYVHWVREGLVRHELAATRASAPATVPPDRREWVAEIAESWIEELGGSGVDLVGDLADLRPVWPDDAEGWLDPDRPDAEAALTRAVDALAWTVEHASRTLAPPVLGDASPPAPRTRLARAMRAWRQA